MIKEKIKNNKIISMLKPLLKDEEVWLVGGYLRDLFLNRESCDIDFVTLKGKAKPIAQRIAYEANGHFVVLDDMYNIYRVVFENKIDYVDFADCTGSGIQEDLKRRDFTINALAYDLQKDELIDTVSGVSDLENGIIRQISEFNIVDDPIRILRAFRFQSELGFGFSSELKTILKEHAGLLNEPAKERVNVEFVKLFGGKEACSALHLMDEYGLLELLIPEVKEIKKVPSNAHHHLPLLEHSIETVNQVQLYYEQACVEVKEHLNQDFCGGISRLAYLKMAAFLHDAGKPATWQIEPDTGRERFIKHDEVGSKLVVKTLRDLKFSKKQIAYIQKIIKNHIYPAGVVTSEEATQKAYTRFYRKMEDEVIDLIAIAYADRMSALGPEITQEMIDKNISGLKRLLEGYLELRNQLEPLPKLLDGKEIMEILNLEASPRLGEIIEKLKEAQISSEVETREDAVKFIKMLNL